MSRQRRLSEQQLDEMAELRERGWGIEKLAAHFTAAGTPISSGAINWQCMRLGADVPTHLQGKSAPPMTPYWRGRYMVRPFTSQEDATLRALAVAGMKVRAIGEQLGRRENSIRGRLLTLGRLDARAEDAA